MLSMAKAQRAHKANGKRGAAKKLWPTLDLNRWLRVRDKSAAWLAKETGLSEATISLIANHQTAGSPDSLGKIAKAFGVSVGELLDLHPEPGGSVVRLWIKDDDRTAVEAFVRTLGEIKR
jgi:transcriptional regulator with XRE-family HTH domain